MARFGPEACRGTFETMGLGVGMYYNSSGFKGVLVTVLVLKGCWYCRAHKGPSVLRVLGLKPKPQNPVYFVGGESCAPLVSLAFAVTSGAEQTLKTTIRMGPYTLDPGIL